MGAFGQRAAGVKLQSPEPSAVVLPSAITPSYTVTVLLASAVPLIVGVVSEVCVPSAGVTITGAAGAIESIVTSTWFDAPLTLPAASVAVAVKLCAPSASGAAGVKVQSPDPSAVVVPSAVTPS